MSKIDTFLQQILAAVYGRDVRGSIHDAIEQCYTDVTNGVTLAETAAGKANTATSNANSATSAANTATANAKTATTNANNAASAANAAASTATKSANQCDTAVAGLSGQVSNLFGHLGLTIVDGKLCVEVVRE